jgi:hypothetical protein
MEIDWDLKRYNGKIFLIKIHSGGNYGRHASFPRPSRNLVHNPSEDKPFPCWHTPLQTHPRTLFIPKASLTGKTAYVTLVHCIDRARFSSYCCLLLLLYMETIVLSGMTKIQLSTLIGPPDSSMWQHRSRASLRDGEGESSQHILMIRQGGVKSAYSQ